MKKKWVNRFFKMAQEAASWSKDRSTGVGAIIVNSTTKEIISVGYNGFPRGVNDTPNGRHERPQKYLWTEHAERNAIYNALRSTSNIDSAAMICTMFPCADCARGIIQSGIKELYTPKPESKRWDESHQIAKIMLNEANVIIKYYENGNTD